MCTAKRVLRGIGWQESRLALSPQGEERSTAGGSRLGVGFPARRDGLSPVCRDSPLPCIPPRPTPSRRQSVSLFLASPAALGTPRRYTPLDGLGRIDNPKDRKRYSQ